MYNLTLQSYPFIMKKSHISKFLLIITLLCVCTAQAQEKVHFILTGGPALRKWEDLRSSSAQHDQWWANFIRASTLRMVEIRQAYGKTAKIVWAVHKNSYKMRGSEDGKPLTTWIENLAKKRNVTLIWYQSGTQAIAGINKQPRGSITTFDFFGHSNKYCFLLDYSSEIHSASKSWLHQDEISKINKSVFSKKCLSQSWGCFTGESMSQVWKAYLGHTLVGAEGKTDYAKVGQGEMPAINGRWVR